MLSDYFNNTWFDLYADKIEFFLRHLPAFVPLLLLSVEELGIPLFVPSDVLIAYTGFRITRGEITFPVALITLIFSIMIGSTALYFIARKWGEHLVLKFGHFIHLREKTIQDLERRFNKSAVLAIIIGRQVPLLRVPVTIFAGMSKVRYRVFFISTLLSATIASSFYLTVGILLGPRVKTVMHTASHKSLIVIIFLLIIAAVFVLWRHFRKK